MQYFMLYHIRDEFLYIKDIFKNIISINENIAKHCKFTLLNHGNSHNNLRSKQNFLSIFFLRCTVYSTVHITVFDDSNKCSPSL